MWWDTVLRGPWAALPGFRVLIDLSVGAGLRLCLSPHLALSPSIVPALHLFVSISQVRGNLVTAATIRE